MDFFLLVPPGYALRMMEGGVVRSFVQKIQHHLACQSLVDCPRVWDGGFPREAAGFGHPNGPHLGRWYGVRWRAGRQTTTWPGAWEVEAGTVVRWSLPPAPALG
jgi:hypothetical protein